MYLFTPRRSQEPLTLFLLYKAGLLSGRTLITESDSTISSAPDNHFNTNLSMGNHIQLDPRTIQAIASRYYGA